MLQTTSLRIRVTIAALIGAAIGAASIVPSAALAKHVTLGPLLLLHAPAVLAGLAYHASSPVWSALFGAATFAAYGLAIAASPPGWPRRAAVVAVGAFHVACLLIVNFCAPLFGL